MAVLTNIPNNTSARDWRDTMNSLIKRVAALEAAGVPVVTPAPAFTTQPSITPTSGTAGSTVYAATPGTVSNGSVVSRAWLLNGTAISTGVTAWPASSGTLAYQETASGPGGTTTSTVQVAAVTAATVTPTPAPSFISQPSISPNTNTAGATTFTATAGNVSNGSITSRSWTINGTVISTGIAASPASSGTLTYQETATGPGGTTQSTVQQVTVATAALPAPAFTTQPTVSPSTGTAGTTTYTATPGAVSNGTITSRAWALNGSTISTGLTAAPASAGTLTYQEFATGSGGSASSSISTRTVSAATPTLVLSPTSLSVASSTAAGTLVSSISNVPAGVTPSVTPNDGRLVIAGDASAGWKVIIGMSALSAGQVNFSVAAAGATGASGVLTVTAPPVVLPAFAYDASTTSYNNARTASGSSPTTAERYGIDRTIKRLKAEGLFAKIQHLGLTGSTAASSAINVVSPGTGNAVMNGSPTFVPPKNFVTGTIASGVLTVTTTTIPLMVGMCVYGAPGVDRFYITAVNGDGTYTTNSTKTLSIAYKMRIVPGFIFPTVSDFIDTGIAANATNPNSFAMGYFGSIARTTSNDMGAQATGVSIYLKNTTLVAGLNGAASSPAGGSSLMWDSGTTQGTGGLISMSRLDATGWNAYHQGVATAFITDATVAPTAATTITVGKVNGQTTTCSRVIQAWFVAPGLTSTEMAKLHAIVQSHMDYVEYGFVDVREAGYAPQANAYDHVVYAMTYSGCLAACELAEMGESVAIVGSFNEFTPEDIGGQITGGLGYTDFDVAGGLGHAPFDSIMEARALRGVATPHTMSLGLDLVVQPRDAWRVLLGRLSRAGVPVFFTGGVVSAAKTGALANTMTTRDGRTFNFKYWLDASEQIDLTRSLGVSSTIGREVQGTAGEALNGYGKFSQVRLGNNASFPVSKAYVIEGDTTSGLLPGVILEDTSKVAGQADQGLQAFNVRCNHNTAIRYQMPFVRPSNYDLKNYEMLARSFGIYAAPGINSIMKPSGLPSVLTTDTNNQGVFSTDVNGSGIDYAACENAGSKTQVYDARFAVEDRIRSYTDGFFWFLASSGDARIPSAISTGMAAYGWDCTHNLDPGRGQRLFGPKRIYVREHARMVSDFILNGNDAVKTDGTAPRDPNTASVISYRFDDHNFILVIRASDPTLQAEGGIDIAQVAGGGSANGADGITPIPISAYYPKRAESTTGFATFGLSATHVAISAARMELTVAQGAVTCAHYMRLARQQGIAVQDVSYSAAVASLNARPTTFPAYLPQVN
jgi:hypothetical protein